MTHLDDIIAKGAGPGRPINNNVRCADGFKLSIVANEYAYCTPRSNDGPYLAVEVGYPSERPEPWADWVTYCESPDGPMETVYGWVPVAFVRALVASHGGEA